MLKVQVEPTELPPNQKFGWFFAFVFSLFAGWFFWRASPLWGVVFSAIAGIFAFCAVFAPRLLTLLNRLWYGLGILLGKIISPIVLGLIFFVLITPVSLVTRLFGRDELKLKRRNLSSYWVDRSPPGPPSDSFKNQY